MKAIYARYGSVEEKDCQTLEEAKDFLRYLENDGRGYAICIYDEEARIGYVAENMEVLGKTEDDVFNQKLDSLKEIGLEPLKIEFYK